MKLGSPVFLNGNSATRILLFARASQSRLGLTVPCTRVNISQLDACVNPIDELVWTVK